MSDVQMTTTEGIVAMLPSGAKTLVMTDDEVEYVRSLVERYTTDNHFTNISDIQDVDRMIMLELQVWRMGTFLGKGGTNYHGDAVDEPELRRAMSAMSNEIRQTKKLLQVDKAAREHERGEASVSGYLAKLRDRAEEFGIHRDMQNAKVLELGMQLVALATYHKNTTVEEQRELHITAEDLFEWIDTVFGPQLMALDEHFRENQTMWIQEM